MEAKGAALRAQSSRRQLCVEGTWLMGVRGAGPAGGYGVLGGWVWFVYFKMVEPWPSLTVDGTELQAEDSGRAAVFCVRLQSPGGGLGLGWGEGLFCPKWQKLWV